MRPGKIVKVPSHEDFATYKGAHCHRLWTRVGPDWICPSCRRSKFEILRWTIRFPRTANRFEDWMTGLHEHHDHARSWVGVGTPRSLPTILCDQCNAADGAAKRRLKLPENFSFSPCAARKTTTNPAVSIRRDHKKRSRDCASNRLSFKAMASI